MGCGSSTAHPPARKYSHADSTLSPVDPEAERLHRELRDWQSASSVGRKTPEPGTATQFIRHTVAVITARIEHGVTGEVDQYEEEVEDSIPIHVNERTAKRIELWRVQVDAQRGATVERVDSTTSDGSGESRERRSIDLSFVETSSHCMSDGCGTPCSTGIMSCFDMSNDTDTPRGYSLTSPPDGITVPPPNVPSPTGSPSQTNLTSPHESGKGDLVLPPPLPPLGSGRVGAGAVRQAAVSARLPRRSVSRSPSKNSMGTNNYLSADALRLLERVGGAD